MFVRTTDSSIVLMASGGFGPPQGAPPGRLAQQAGVAGRGGQPPTGPSLSGWAQVTAWWHRSTFSQCGTALDGLQLLRSAIGPWQSKFSTLSHYEGKVEALRDLAGAVSLVTTSLQDTIERDLRTSGNPRKAVVSFARVYLNFMKRFVEDDVRQRLDQAVNDHYTRGCLVKFSAALQAIGQALEPRDSKLNDAAMEELSRVLYRNATTLFGDREPRPPQIAHFESSFYNFAATWEVVATRLGISKPPAPAVATPPAAAAPAPRASLHPRVFAQPGPDFREPWPHHARPDFGSPWPYVERPDSRSAGPQPQRARVPARSMASARREPAPKPPPRRRDADMPNATGDIFYYGVAARLRAAVDRRKNSIDRHTQPHFLSTLASLQHEEIVARRAADHLREPERRRALDDLDHYLSRRLPREMAGVIHLIESHQAGKALGELGKIVGRLRERSE